MATKEKTTKEKQVVRRQFQGKVISKKKDKTAQVVVERMKMHPKYHKQYRVIKKYAVHDEKNEARVDDVIVFQECRPLSKTKRWRLVRIIEHGNR